MTYNSVANTDPITGSYAVVHYDQPGLFARIISRFTKSKWTHVFLYIGDGEIIEAAKGGVRRASLDEYATGCTLLWSQDELTADESVGIKAAAMWALGTPYNWLDILAMGLSTQGVTIGPVEHRLERPDRMICSQLVTHAWRSAGIILFPDKHDSRVTPGDLGKRIEDKPIPMNA